MKGKSNRKLLVVLMNDLLFLLERSSTVSSFQFNFYRKPIPLDEIVVREVDNPKSFSNYGKYEGEEVWTLLIPFFRIDVTWFQIVHIDNIITVKAESAQEKREWMNGFEEAIKNIRTMEKRQSSNLASARSSQNQISTLGGCIGTVEIHVQSAKNLIPAQNGKLKNYKS